MFGALKYRVMNQLEQISPLEKMLRQQVMERGIRDERLIAAMRAVPRELFFPPEGRQFAYLDRAAPIGFGQTISQPYMVALMTHRLDVHPDHKILEIGTGTGYQTAILAHLAAEVYTIERVKPLLDEAFERVLASGAKNVHFRHADGTLGWPEAAPFDRILIAAGSPSLPVEMLLKNLKEDGVAIVPIGSYDEQMLTRVQRHGDDLEKSEICPCRFVKLIGREGWKE
jgi:protein-L-isoaspartate(D-aspartate) O-methyltransferase